MTRSEDEAPAPKAGILLVDDQPANLLALDAVLADLGPDLTLVKAGSGEEALRQVLRQDFAVILLDVQMAGLNGFETAQAIRSRPRSRHTPIIFLTAYESPEFSPGRAYSLGAVDFLVKPIVPDILRAKVAGFVDLYRKTVQIQRQAEQLRQLERREFERQLAEQALRQSEERLRLAHAQREQLRVTLASIGDAVIVTDAQGRITFLNPVAEALLACRQEEALGKPLGDVFRLAHEQTRQPIEDPVALVLRQGAVIGMANHTVLVRRDGSERPVEDSAAPIRDEQGRTIGVILVCRDVTEKRLAEETRLRLAAIVESSDDAIIGKTLGGTITSWNRAAERLYGYRADEVVGRPISLLVPPEMPDEVPGIMDRLQRGERVAHYETVRLRKDGTRLDVAVTISPVRDAEGRLVGASAIARDITERKRLEAELRRHAEELMRRDRQKDEFLAMLAHELRNPMAPLLTSLHIVRQPAADRRARDHALDMIGRSIRHLARLVDDLLETTRITRGKVLLNRERLDLARLVRTAAGDRRAVLERAGLTLTVEAPETPVWLQGDGTRLTQVLNNLLDNAGKFTDCGGQVAVRLRPDPARREAVLSVQDTGIGIEPEVLPHVFETFAQGDRSLERTRGGLGLGLSVVKGLVELHGGSVAATSAGPGRGTEFTVRLPTEEEPAALRLHPGERQPGGDRLRVAVIEDNRDGADSLRMLLEALGHEARVAYSGPDGVRLVLDWRPDIVVSDIGLPGLNGLDLAAELRRHPETARTRLIGLSGYGSEEDRQRAREAGFDHYLVKPADPDELQRLLA